MSFEVNIRALQRAVSKVNTPRCLASAFLCEFGVKVEMSCPNSGKMLGRTFSWHELALTAFPAVFIRAVMVMRGEIT